MAGAGGAGGGGIAGEGAAGGGGIAGVWAAGGGGGAGSVVVGFGTVNSIEKADWFTSVDKLNLFPKGSVATIMDVATQKVFSVYRWSGGNHADCVPTTSSDTSSRMSGLSRGSGLGQWASLGSM